MFSCTKMLETPEKSAIAGMIDKQSHPPNLEDKPLYGFNPNHILTAEANANWRDVSAVTQLSARAAVLL